MITVVATLAKVNRNRGTITWKFITKGDKFYALRNDDFGCKQRRINYPSMQSMLEGYHYMRINYNFKPVELTAA